MVTVVVVAEVAEGVAEVVTDMIKVHLVMTTIILMTLTVWNTTTQADNAIEWINDREYSLTVLDNDKPLPLIEIKYQFICEDL